MLKYNNYENENDDDDDCTKLIKCSTIVTLLLDDCINILMRIFKESSFKYILYIYIYLYVSEK